MKELGLLGVINLVLKKSSLKIFGMIFVALCVAQGAFALTGPRRVLLGGGKPTVSLSNSTVASTASIGTVIGTLSVAHGIGSYTFTLTSNPGSLFSISGSSLKVAASLSAGSDPITVQASNGAGSVVSQPFTITVTSAGSALLVDNSDPALLVDNTDPACLVGGC
jgi:hypothetical protein